MEALEVLSIIAQDRRTIPTSLARSHTDPILRRPKSAQSGPSSPQSAVPTISADPVNLTYELHKLSEKQRKLAECTVETSRVQDDVDPQIYLAFLQNVSKQFKQSTTNTRTHSASELHSADTFYNDHDCNPQHDGMSEPDQPQDGLSEFAENDDGSSPELVALLRHRPQPTSQQINQPMDDDNSSIADCTHKRHDKTAVLREPKRPGRCWNRMWTLVLTIVPLFLFLQASDYPLSLELPVSLSEPIHRIAQPVMQYMAMLDTSINILDKDYDMSIFGSIPVTSSNKPSTDDAKKNTKTDKPKAKRVKRDLSRYTAAPVRPDSSIVHEHISPIKRLELRLQQRLNTMQQQANDVPSNFGSNGQRFDDLFPLFDTTSSCACAWEYKMGNYWPRLSCRERLTGAACDEFNGPIQRTVAFIEDKTQVIMGKVNTWIPKIRRSLTQKRERNGWRTRLSH